MTAVRLAARDSPWQHRLRNGYRSAAVGALVGQQRHNGDVTIRRLPNLSPEQVIRLQDALLANADTLLTSAIAILDLDHVALARSLAILGLEESGKAIAVHERRVAMVSAPEGEPFRCDLLDELWASHQQKLEAVHRFLVAEEYWFGEPSDPAKNAAALGTIKRWARRHDTSKQRGFYVGISKTGEPMAPTDVTDTESLRELIGYVHQIGWQLRLGEHIEGRGQDEREGGSPPMSAESLGWLTPDNEEEAPAEQREFMDQLRASLTEGVPGTPLNNAAYRFNPPGADRSPFRNFGKPGYEAETRELLLMQDELDRESAADPDSPEAPIDDELGHPFASLGPFYNDTGMLKRLHITAQELDRRVTSHELLAPTTGSGQRVYPTWQFTDDGHTLPGLTDVLTRLLTALDPWTVAIWLATPSERLGDASAIECLRTGHVADVEAAAAEDSARWVT